MELKRCARCGKFYASDVEVCQECEKKDFLLIIMYQELQKMKYQLIQELVRET